MFLLTFLYDFCIFLYITFNMCSPNFVMHCSNLFLAIVNVRSDFRLSLISLFIFVCYLSAAGFWNY